MTHLLKSRTHKLIYIYRFCRLYSLYRREIRIKDSYTFKRWLSYQFSQCFFLCNNINKTTIPYIFHRLTEKCVIHQFKKNYFQIHLLLLDVLTYYVLSWSTILSGEDTDVAVDHIGAKFTI